ncbi:hypothetical protein FHQ19_11685, partial [Pasteurellaceae bacterium UScroc12]
MNHFNLDLIKFIQENSPVSIDIVLSKYQKTLSTIKRAIKEINDYLEPENKIHLINAKIITPITYRDYIKFIKSISLKRYISTPDERIKLFILQATLFEAVNRKEFYSRLNLSYSTLKNDIILLKEKTPNHIEFMLKNRNSWAINGNEISIRINFCKNIFNILELDQNNNLAPHKANSPIDNLISEQFLTILRQNNLSTEVIYQTINSKVELSYNSKKYLIIYLSISLYRISQHHIIQNIKKIPIKHINYVNILQFDNTENQFINILLSALNHKTEKQSIIDPQLYKL